MCFPQIFWTETIIEEGISDHIFVNLNLTSFRLLFSGVDRARKKVLFCFKLHSIQRVRKLIISRYFWPKNVTFWQICQIWPNIWLRAKEAEKGAVCCKKIKKMPNLTKFAKSCKFSCKLHPSPIHEKMESIPDKETATILCNQRRLTK